MLLLQNVAVHRRIRGPIAFVPVEPRDFIVRQIRNNPTACRRTAHVRGGGATTMHNLRAIRLYAAIWRRTKNDDTRHGDRNTRDNGDPGQSRGRWLAYSGIGERYVSAFTLVAFAACRPVGLFPRNFLFCGLVLVRLFPDVQPERP